MATTKIDIDQPARQAAQQKNFDRVREQLYPKLPLQPAFWSVLLEPLEPKETSVGGIVLAKPTQDAQKILTTIGRILAIGSLAFTGKTASGLSLSDEKLKFAVGDHVLYQRYTGQELYLYSKGQEEDRRLVMITDSEILGLVSDPSAFRIYV